MPAQSSSDFSSAQPPGWQYCGVGATSVDPVGCRGIHVTGRNRCLAHLDDADRAAYLAGLRPGGDIDHRGTPFTAELLRQLLRPLSDAEGQRPHFGLAQFAGAVFAGPARFDRAVFAGDARFGGAVFTGGASFSGTEFSGPVRFHDATFAGRTSFSRAVFSGRAMFDGAVFAGRAMFVRSVFSEPAVFTGAAFAEEATFRGAIFSGPARMSLACAGELILDGVVLSQPTTMEIAARRVSLRGVRPASTTTLRLRYAQVDLSGAVLEQPFTLAAEPAPFIGHTGRHRVVSENIRRSDAEPALSDEDPGVRVVSVSGVDASQLSLIDIDLSRCRFAGTINLDQLHLTGQTRFATPPTGWRRKGLRLQRWSRRQILVEEHHWRVTGAGALASGSDPGPWDWRLSPHHPAPDRTPGPETVATLYRQLRKALEDSKDEPGAADFYYGEMEMRRHTSSSTRSDRCLLTVYWAVSGYGLRASRALAWLGIAMTTTVLAMMMWGLPAEATFQVTTGRQVEAGQNLVLATETPDPHNPSGPVGERVTMERFEQALRVVINSTVFRSSGQDLTTAGTYIDITSRIAEPALLALAVLAIRARVKR